MESSFKLDTLHSQYPIMPKVELDTPQFRIIFHLSPSKYNNRVTITITMTNKSLDYPYAFRSHEDTVEKVNLIDVCTYLNQNSDKIKSGRRPDSIGYLDYDMLFNVKSYMGDYDNKEDIVYFSILFLVNTGFTEDRRDVFMGGEMSVTSKMMEQFAIDMEKAIELTDQSIYGD